MTSQKSSISTSSFTFWSALKGNFVLPLINLVALMLLVPVSCAMTIKGFSGESYDPRTGALQTFSVLIVADFGVVIHVKAAELMKITPSAFTQGIAQGKADVSPGRIVAGHVQSGVLDLFHYLLYILFK